MLERHYTEKVKISLVLFDEIEKASDALWQLLLGVLDKGTLTLGDNRRVDFSHSLIFLTSNLGSQEISKLMSGGLGYTSSPSNDDEPGPEDLPGGSGGGAAQVFAGVHEPHRQGDCLPHAAA